MLGEKIKLLREEKGWTQRELAKRIDLNNTVLSRIEAGKKTVDHDLLKTFSDILEVSCDLLLDDSDRFMLLKNKQNKYMKYLPILGTIRAGIPLLAEGNFDGEVEIPSDLEADFALRVTGDSMSWTGIHDGDIAILCQINIPSHGMAVAAGVENDEWEATLKFYVEDNGNKFLRAANPSYEDIQITSKHRIIGHVIGIQKNSPSLQHYRDILMPKDIEDAKWHLAIEKAVSSGLDADKTIKLIELFSHMIRQI